MWRPIYVHVLTRLETYIWSSLLAYVHIYRDLSCEIYRDLFSKLFSTHCRLVTCYDGVDVYICTSLLTYTETSFLAYVHIYRGLSFDMYTDLSFNVYSTSCRLVTCYDGLCWYMYMYVSFDIYRDRSFDVFTTHIQPSLLTSTDTSLLTYVDIQRPLFWHTRR